MDKYQDYLMNSYVNRWDLLVEGRRYSLNSQTIKEGKILLKQNEDITIKDYVLYVDNIAVDNIYAITGSTQIKFKQKDDPDLASIGSGPKVFYLPIDFDKKINKIKIVFKNNLADDLILNVEYEVADKEKYFAKKEQDRKKLLLQTANIRISTGIDLVNVYFQPCCGDYERTEIVLYKDNMMLSKNKVNEEEFFKSINGLAFGKYEIVLKQFDKNGEILLETDKIPFSINAPNYGCNEKPTVVI